MIDSRALKSMKAGAVLINTARGGLVRDADLLQALQQEEIAGAGLDVFESESDPSLLAVTEQLIKLPNVVVTPHAGASTVDGLTRTNLIDAQSVVEIGRASCRARVFQYG